MLRAAVPAELVQACQDIIWAELAQRGIRRDGPATWAEPVVRINCPEGGPFPAAGTRPAVQDACDQLIGAGRWWRREGIGGTVPVRFPGADDPGDAGWHIEGSYQDGGGGQRPAPARRSSGPPWASAVSAATTPATWTEPVVRINCPEGGPFAAAGTRMAVQEAYNH